MTAATLVRRSLRHYWRSRLATLLGATVACAILVGALTVGDSVRHTLRANALRRLGAIDLALMGHSRFVRERLATDLSAELGRPVAPAILLRGTCAAGEGTGVERAATAANIVGVEATFWRLGGTAPLLGEADEAVVVNERLARTLGLRAGAELLLRVEKPGAVSRDAPLTSLEDASAVLRLPLRAIATDGQFGRFSLAADPLPPNTVFVPLRRLQEALDRRGRVNVLLVGTDTTDDQRPTTDDRRPTTNDQRPTTNDQRPTTNDQRPTSGTGRAKSREPGAGSREPGARSQEPGARSASAASLERERSEPRARAQRAFERHWRLADGGLTLRRLPRRDAVELRTERVFLEPAVERAGRAALPGARGVLTYFVNELRVGDRATPYSTVSALEGPPLPAGMRDDEIVINDWLANDLQAKVGDTLRLTYYVVGTMRRLREETAAFRIRSIVPLAGAAADRDLMPEIPGLTDSENCRDWEPGVPIRLDRIRDRDEQYWDAHRGTPKAFLTLRAGQRIWSQRFGNLTALRAAPGSWLLAPGTTNDQRPTTNDQRRRSEEQRTTNNEQRTTNNQLREPGAEKALLRHLRPADLGLVFTPVREQALGASAASVDFGMLFLGFSIFLIVAALLLTALLFGFGVEQRSEELGVLLALGFPRREIGRLLLLEGGALALVAALLGALAGVLYTWIVLYGLSTVWRGAVAGAEITLHVEPATLGIGGAVAFAVALLTIGLVVRRHSRRVVRALLQGTAGDAEEVRRATGRSGDGSPRRRFVLYGYGLLAAILAVAGIAGPAGAAPGLFFGAGSLLLLAGLSACRALLVPQGHQRSPAGAWALSLSTLGRRNSARRPGRSVATIALLACGSFLVIAVGANRHDPAAEAGRRSSGTGGFALYGESALPVYEDLNREEAWDAFGMEPELLKNVQIVALRVREGDDASCLNLARARAPRLLGIPVEEFRRRRAFTFTRTIRRTEDPWALLTAGESDGTVPVVGDVNTVVWSLRKSVGDTVEYVDEHGRPFRARIVGIMANSILQGSLLIAEEHLLERYPSQEGYRVFLVDQRPTTNEGRPTTNDQRLGRGERGEPTVGPRGRRGDGASQEPGARSQEPGAGSASEASREIAYGLQDAGMELTTASERLAAFNAVEETYLSIFAALGGLGLLLGSVGLGVVVLRNVLERRGELGLLRAVGFPRRALQWLLFSEAALLLTLGLGVGVVAGLIAVAPALRSPGVDVPYASIAATLAAVFASGFLWTWGAAVFALRGPLLVALRDE